VGAEWEALLAWVQVTVGKQLQSCILYDRQKGSTQLIYDRLPRRSAIFLEQTTKVVIFS